VLITSPACGLVVAENHTNVSIPNGSDGTIDVIVGGAFGAIQYLWNDGNTNEDRANLTAGTYIVTVTDAGNCSDILNILITMPACALSVAEAVTHVTVPNGNDGSVQLSVVLANGNVTYSWNDGSTLQNRTGLTAGTYTVTVTDSANCSDITTFSINQPACALILKRKPHRCYNT
jgi:hypothetical protein